MAEQQRRSTNNKSRKTVRILLIITGILGLILIGVAVYFYAIGDSSQNNQPTTTTTCGCYFVDPSVISECGDTRRAFKFNLNTTSSDETCKAQCSTSELSANLLNSSTDPDLYQICELKNLTDVRCNSMTITDQNGKIVTGKVSDTDEITIEATFDAEYSNHSFTINNQATEPSIISSDKKTVSLDITDLSNTTTLEIVATAEDSQGEQIYSTVCRRLVEIEQEGEENVSAMNIETRANNENKTVISGIDISVGNLSTTDNKSIIFSFTGSIANLTMTEGFTVDTNKGKISILESDLYNTENFAEDRSFSSLSNATGEITITADVRESSKSLGTISKEVTFREPEETEEPEETSTTSSFSVQNTGTPACVERITPNNTENLTITVQNGGTTSEGIESIKNKLPLGFEYEAGSTKINNVEVEDSEYVTTTTVGDTIEIVWSKGSPWVISANQTFTITFNAIAGSEALTGDNLNEVIVTPEKVPTNPDDLRAELDIRVQQDCDNEDEEVPVLDPSNTNTGIFDSAAGRIFAGILTIFIGWYIYTNPIGSKISKQVLSSNAYQNAEMTTWKIFKPKRYFEEKTVRKLKKE